MTNPIIDPMHTLLDARANRRSAIGAIGAAGAVIAAVETPAAHAQTATPAAETETPTLDAKMNPINPFLDRPVSDLVNLPALDLSDAEKERHRIYSLLLMATLAQFFSGNKYGQNGEYPWRADQIIDGCVYGGGLYLGHNIACLAVDGIGNVIDFDFNHNDIFNSSVEHAESRLIRRIFTIAQSFHNWELRDLTADPVEESYGNLLSDVTLYTSLESCSQCSGIMTLGRVKDVVYLQHDPSQYNIGNILYNITAPSYSPAPRPIPARSVGFDYAVDLDNGFVEFIEGVEAKPFYIEGDFISKSPSITSYLCTDLVLDIYKRGAAEFASMTLAHPDFAPEREVVAAAETAPNARTYPLTNAEALAAARHFFAFVVKPGRRGTPHRD